MAKEVWFWSDLHLGHENIYKFVNYDGSPCRPWGMDEINEAEELMIQNYNKLVKPEHTVYWLGDISFKNTVADRLMPRFNKSRRILIPGNHDYKLTAKFWLKYFDDLRGCYNLENYIITHIPVSAASKGRFKRNIHGHTHGNFVEFLSEDNKLTKIRDPWYKNVCVEVLDYKPINFSEIKEETDKLISKGLITIPSREERVI